MTEREAELTRLVMALADRVAAAAGVLAKAARRNGLRGQADEIEEWLRETRRIVERNPT